MIRHSELQTRQNGTYKGDWKAHLLTKPREGFCVFTLTLREPPALAGGLACARVGEFARSANSWGKRIMICLCHSVVWHNPLFRVTTNSTEATERTRSPHRRGSRANASGQCEERAKCERMLELPPSVATGAPRAATRTEKAKIGNEAKLNDLSTLLEDEVAVADRAVSFSFQFLRWRGMGGGAAQKCKGNGAGCGRPR